MTRHSGREDMENAFLNWAAHMKNVGRIWLHNSAMSMGQTLSSFSPGMTSNAIISETDTPNHNVKRTSLWGRCLHGGELWRTQKGWHASAYDNNDNTMAKNDDAESEDSVICAGDHAFCFDHLHDHCSSSTVHVLSGGGRVDVIVYPK